MTIELSPQLESQLRTEAARKGIDAQTYVRQVLEATLASDHFQLPDDVADLCQKLGIREGVHQAVELAQTAFRPILNLTIELQADPDSDESRVLLEIQVDADEVEASQIKRRFTDLWINAAQPEVRDRIRLVYHPCQ